MKTVAVILIWLLIYTITHAILDSKINKGKITISEKELLEITKEVCNDSSK